MWSEDAEKSQILDADHISMKPEYVADIMIEMLENPKHGDGTILEATAMGTRVVPAFNAPPPNIEEGGVLDYEKKVTEMLKSRLAKDGLRV